MKKKLYHVVISIGDATGVVVFGEQDDMNDASINEYLCLNGFPIYDYLENSATMDHEQGVMSCVYSVPNPLFNNQQDMVAFYAPENN